MPQYDNKITTVSRNHWDEHWSEEMIRAAAEKHVMSTWTPTKTVKNLMIADRAEGVYFYDSKGKKYLDWTR